MELKKLFENTGNKIVWKIINHLENNWEDLVNNRNKVENTIRNYLTKNQEKLEKEYNIARLDIDWTTEEMMRKYDSFVRTTEKLKKIMDKEKLRLEDERLSKIIKNLYKNIEQREAILYVIEFYKDMKERGKAPKK